ncbi:ROK family protein [Aquabacterium sp. OR-4]|uniref:ROK family protein n=1 Tax=Aquabacterium sp. OR-4 TaxID=2978127 RepID=UPI0021B319C6|nr:ROK family protein [Aquabacterium sp. OR-4]MDT7836857.1 ROK family protein [Aquabacterium sp. OR-4]
MSAPRAGLPAMGIDVGGTKIEAVLLDAHGAQRWRERRASPSTDYAAMLDSIGALVAAARAMAPEGLSIGLGTPGSLSADGRIKNANTQCLNGRALAADLQLQLGQPVRLANDANCLALSEATDGAGQGAPVVFAAILGTGTGAGIAVDGRVLTGPNRLAGEWGHNPLPWAPPDEPQLPCYCGQQGCVETLVSGPGMAREHALRHGGSLSALQIAAAAEAGEAAAQATLARWHQRLARALAGVINLLDPQVIVLGGGLSRIASTYAVVPALWQRWVFAGGLQEPVRTRLLPARHGDASGVRGAAWLWREAALAAGRRQRAHPPPGPRRRMQG